HLMPGIVNTLSHVLPLCLKQL
ncbi:hypothetical protein A2U01_0115404, partial [Trifolium medium]|nr:hypothetical protein [Trifolium medium]